MLNFLSRQPFALLGAFALLALPRGLIEWQEDIGTWIEAFRSVSQVLWDFLLGWLQLEIPQIIKDYLTIGLVGGGALVRGGIETNDGKNNTVGAKIMVSITIISISLFVWPFILFLYLVTFITTVIIGTDYIDQFEHESRKERRELVRRRSIIYFETFIYAAIIIAVNYALLDLE